MARGRRAYAFTVCVRGDDDKTFEFQTTSDSTDLTSRVTTAIANGRHVRCYLLAADPDAQPRGEKYLVVSKGYRRGSVAV